jgi:Domain of unknown function (DUF4349)
MSQRDLVAELRAARVEAPPEVRARVRLIAASAKAPTRRLTWRRALLVAVPAIAAVAAAVVLTRPGAEPQRATPDTAAATHGAVAQSGALRSLSVPAAPKRVQSVAETLALRVDDVSSGVKRAVRIATSLGGYATSVDASTAASRGSADLVLRVPRARVQEAVAQLSQLGTILEEHVAVVDRTAALNATDRLIARLQRRLAALRAEDAPAAEIAALTKRIESLQRSEAATRRTAHYATVRLHLATEAPAVPVPHHHGPLHGVRVALEWLGIGAVYALAVGGPVAVLLALAWLAARVVRRRREAALLSR